MVEKDTSETKIKAVIWVELMDKRKQKITAGRPCDEVTAGELKDALCRKIGITCEGAEAFAIWICSSLLQLQLKPSHYPTTLCDHWFDLLAQFATVTEQQAATDTPVIMLMRNVFYPLSQERILIKRDYQARYYLASEGIFNILSGRYPVEEELAFLLGAIQFKLEERNLEDYRQGTLLRIAEEILPWDVFRRRKLSPIFLDKRIRFHLKSLEATPPQLLDHVYMHQLYKQPCYRCAFFQGQTEVEGHRRDVLVRVGITWHNIFIWNIKTNKTLAEIENNDISTQLLKGYHDGNDESRGRVQLDLWLINFKEGARGEETPPPSVPVFSKQACMMQTMMERLNYESALHKSDAVSPTSPQTAPETDAGGTETKPGPSNLTSAQLVPEVNTTIGAKHVSRKENIRGFVMTDDGKIKKSTFRQTSTRSGSSGDKYQA